MPPSQPPGDPSTSPPSSAGWESIATLPEYTALVRARRRYSTSALILSMGSLAIFVLLASFAREMMSLPVAGGMTLGIALALLEFVLLVATGAVWMRSTDRSVTPLEQSLVSSIERAGGTHVSR